MAWDDISKSLATVIDERLSNPLVSSVAISWVGWNFKFLLIVVSNNTVSDKLALFDKVYPNIWWGLGFGLVLPVVTAYGYLYLLPLVSRPFFRKWRENLRDFNGIKEEIPIDQIITKTEKIALIEEQSKVREESEQLRMENRKLRTDLGIAQAKTDNYDALASNNGTLTAKINELENAALRKDADLMSALNKSVELESQLAELPALKSELEAAKNEKQVLQIKSGVMLDQTVKLREEVIAVNHRLASVEDRARIANLEAFSQAVFQSGFNDKLTAHQSNRLNKIFSETENGSRDLTSMFKIVVNMLRQMPPKTLLQGMTGQEKKLTHDAVRNARMTVEDVESAGSGFQRDVKAHLAPNKNSDGSPG